jgi:serine/threonine protein kinase
MPWYSNGTLKDLVLNYPTALATNRLSIARGIALGMEYLHNLGIMHRDLKPSNVLIQDNYSPVIADFGVSRPQSESTTLATVGSVGCILKGSLI